MIVLLGTEDRVGKTTLCCLQSIKERVLSLGVIILTIDYCLKRMRQQNWNIYYRPMIWLLLMKLASVKISDCFENDRWSKVRYTDCCALFFSTTWQNEINEPATGRLIEYNLYPFSLAELVARYFRAGGKRLLENKIDLWLIPRKW